LLFLAVAAAALAFPVLAQELPSAGWIARETAATYRLQARYPASSRVATENDWDPGIRRTPSRITVPARDGEGATLTVWPAQVAFLDPTPIDLFAELHDPRGRSVAGTLTGEVVDASGQRVAKIQFFDDGVTPDAVAGDGRYSARIVLPKSGSGVRAESFLVRITSLAANETVVRYATTSFQRSRPGAMLTGQYRDRITGGNLTVSAQVLVKLPGRYHLAASLVATNGAPIGAAQNAVHLAPGAHWIDLGFYGLMFHERSTSGPFRVDSITLTDTSAMPNALGTVVEDAHTTRAYAPSRFTAQPFGEPTLLDAAARLEAEATRANR
jgi:hypothetical protein